MEKRGQKLEVLNKLCKDLSKVNVNLPNDFGKSSEKIVYNKLT